MGLSESWTIELDIARLLDQAPDGDSHSENVKGRESVNRALGIAAAGSHSVLMFAPPGSGKPEPPHLRYQLNLIATTSPRAVEVGTPF
jgi:hypothetical protein